ncbi:MAG: hypothetical protein KBA66_02865 [Leptospiraceae bacterium]|nr:hypothetical protein [Leptospiraceae bacterium]
MMLQNKLFLVLFNSKEGSKWESWKRFASKNNYLFSLIHDPLERPIIRGLLNDKPVSVEAIYEGYLEKELQLKIKSPIYNPKENYLLVQDKKVYNSKSGIFNKSLQGICENKNLEEKFFIKSDTERLPSQILNIPDLSKDLISQNNFSIEIIGFEMILTSYAIIEINREFIDLLKLFYFFLTSFEKLSLTTTSIRK